MGERGPKRKWSVKRARREIGLLAAKSPKTGADRVLLHRLRKLLGVSPDHHAWTKKDWPAAARDVIARGYCRHLGDYLLQLGLPYRTHRLWFRQHPSWAAVTSTLPRKGRRHTSLFCEYVRGAQIAEFRALRDRMLQDGCGVQEANQEAADAVISRKRDASRTASKARRHARYGTDCDQRRNKEMASAARAAGKIPKGWRGVEVVRRRAQAEFQLRQTWRTIRAIAIVHGISHDEAVELFKTAAKRKQARAVLVEMRRRIEVHGPKGELMLCAGSRARADT